MRAPRLPRLTLQRAVAFACFAVWTQEARGASPDVEHTQALESFRRGTLFVERGRLQDAIDAFRDALHHEPSSVGARLDLADCYEKIGAPAPAWREYILAEAFALRANDARSALAHSSAVHLEPALLRVSWAPDATAGATMQIDGDLVSMEIVGRGSIALAPGPHRLELTAPGKTPLVVEVSGQAGDTRRPRIEFNTGVPSAPPREESPSHEETSSSQRTWGLAIGALGVAGVVTGAATGLVASSKKTTLRGEVNDPSIGASRFYDDRSTAERFATISTVGFVVGAAALATGSIVFFTAPRVRTSALRVRVNPTLGGVLVGGAF